MESRKETHLPRRLAYHQTQCRLLASTRDQLISSVSLLAVSLSLSPCPRDWHQGAMSGVLLVELRIPRTRSASAGELSSAYLWIARGAGGGARGIARSRLAWLWRGCCLGGLDGRWSFVRHLARFNPQLVLPSAKPTSKDFWAATPPLPISWPCRHPRSPAGGAGLHRELIDTFKPFQKSLPPDSLLDDTMIHDVLPQTALRALQFAVAYLPRLPRLHAKGVPLPKATSTGATIVGFMYDGGVVIAVVSLNPQETFGGGGQQPTRVMRDGHESYERSHRCRQELISSRHRTSA